MITCTNLGQLGRFGNQLFQIAGVIGIARANSQTYCFPRWFDPEYSSDSNADGDFASYFKHPLPRFEERPYVRRTVDWGFHNVSLDKGDYDIDGHLQSPRYFEHCIKEVRHFLTVKNEPRIARGVCAVHVRAGDYLACPTAKHPRLDIGYYDSAFAKMPRGTEYIVFSDEPIEARRLLGNSFHYAEGDWLEDFRLMKTCNHFITANSSFSLMAAILSPAEDKLVVCPKRWFGSSSHLSGNDCYPGRALVV